MRDKSTPRELPEHAIQECTGVSGQPRVPEEPMNTTNPTAEERTDRRRYLTTGELREEIAYAVGGDPSRYGVDSDRGIVKADLLRIAERLCPAESDLDLRACDLSQLYPAVCAWAGGEYRPNAGNQWGISRENLKKIHRAVRASDPREVVSA